MSERAQSVLLEDIEYMGPIRTKEVQKAEEKTSNVVITKEKSGGSRAALIID